MTARWGLAVAAAMVAAMPAIAAKLDTSTPAPALEAVTACRKITADAERLACFDASVAKLDAAASNRDVVVLDRQQIRETRRSLFGFTLPKLALFGGREGTPEKEEFTQLTAKLTAVGRTSDGGYTFVLDTGARWRQTDVTAFGRTPRPGDEVTIFQAALGSFKMRIGNAPAIRVRREG